MNEPVDEDDCFLADEITCPFCGEADGDSWEKGYDDGDCEIYRCGWCDKLFWVSTRIDICYSSEKLCPTGDLNFDGVKDNDQEESASGKCSLTDEMCHVAGCNNWRKYDNS